MPISFIIKGMRPKTLVAGIVPSLTAFSLLQNKTELEIYITLFFCIFLALFIQIATNFYNDAIDFQKGADDNRVGPERITTQDNIPVKKVFKLGHIFLFMAFIIGAPLCYIGGWPFVVLGLASLFLAYGYTGGPFPLAYLGLGELFVFLFFGLVATMGSFYLLNGALTLSSFVLSIQIGFLSSVLIAINNYRDRLTDKEVGKNTLATRLSRSKYLFFINILLFFPYFFLLYFIIFQNFKYLIVLAGIGLAYQIKMKVELISDSELKKCNELLALSGKHLLVFSILFFGVGLWK